MNESRDLETRSHGRRGFLKTTLAVGAGLALVVALGGCTSSEGNPEGAIDNPTEPVVTEVQELETSGEQNSEAENSPDAEAQQEVDEQEEASVEDETNANSQQTTGTSSTSN